MKGPTITARFVLDPSSRLHIVQEQTARGVRSWCGSFLVGAGPLQGEKPAHEVCEDCRRVIGR